VTPVDIVLREDGYQIDKVVISTGTIPSGDGPDESFRLGDFLPPFEEVGGLVSMEAENFDVTESRSSAPHQWSFETAAPGYLGGGYMHVSDEWISAFSWSLRK